MIKKGYQVIVAPFEVESIISIRAYEETQMGRTVIIFSSDSDFYVYLGLLFLDSTVIGKLFIMKSTLGSLRNDQEELIPILSGDQISGWFLNQHGFDILLVAGIVGSDYSHGGLKNLGWPRLRDRLKHSTMSELLRNWNVQHEATNVLEGIHGYLDQPIGIEVGNILRPTFGHYIGKIHQLVIPTTTFDHFPILPSQSEIENMTEYCQRINYPFSSSVFNFTQAEFGTFGMDDFTEPIDDSLEEPLNEQSQNKRCRILYKNEDFAYPGGFDLGPINKMYNSINLNIMLRNEAIMKASARGHYLTRSSTMRCRSSNCNRNIRTSSNRFYTFS
jgi:hypothetical protein